MQEQQTKLRKQTICRAAGARTLCALERHLLRQHATSITQQSNEFYAGARTLSALERDLLLRKRQALQLLQVLPA